MKNLGNFPVPFGRKRALYQLSVSKLAKRPKFKLWGMILEIWIVALFVLFCFEKLLFIFNKILAIFMCIPATFIVLMPLLELLTTFGHWKHGVSEGELPLRCRKKCNFQTQFCKICIGYYHVYSSNASCLDAFARKLLYIIFPLKRRGVSLRVECPLRSWKIMQFSDSISVGKLKKKIQFSNSISAIWCIFFSVADPEGQPYGGRNFSLSR